MYGVTFNLTDVSQARSTGYLFGHLCVFFANLIHYSKPEKQQSYVGQVGGAQRPDYVLLALKNGCTWRNQNPLKHSTDGHGRYDLV